jgi:hypothetical protein
LSLDPRLRLAHYDGVTVMVTEQLYRDRAKEARQEAGAVKDPDKRRQLLEVAKAYEHFADLPGKTPWHIERVERKK